MFEVIMTIITLYICIKLDSKRIDRENRTRKGQRQDMFGNWY